LGVVDDDLVDDYLGEQRRGKAHQLDGEGGGEDFLPQLLVLEEFGDEPFAAEGGCGLAVFVGEGFAFLGEEEGAGFEGGFEFFGGGVAGLVLAGEEVEELVAVGFAD